MNLIYSPPLFQIAVRNFLKISLVVVFVFGSLVYFNFVQAESEVVLIERSWVREVPPGVPTLAAYMDITNKTDSTVTITSVSSNIAKKTELHEVKMDNDVMQMRKMDAVIIQPGETLDLKSGGSHVMLMGVDKSFNEGDEIEIEFELHDHPAVKVLVPVKKEL